MILVVGSRVDSVFPRVISCLERNGLPFTVLDQADPEAYRVTAGLGSRGPEFRLEGQGCRGTRPVGAVFVRHSMAPTRDPSFLRQVCTLQIQLNRMLSRGPSHVVNPPANAVSNYSKPYQESLLAKGGFDIPRSLVTNIPEEAMTFFESCGRRVIFKGVSNVVTLAQKLDADKLARLAHLPTSPTLFQEFVEGVDFRVHVVGEQAFVTRLASANEDYRRALRLDRDEVSIEAVDQDALPDGLVQKCIEMTRSLDLVVGGLDFKATPEGRFVALELNPFPQFTFYEGRSGQPITQAVVDYLAQHEDADTNVFA